ncbi:hypothetical protein MCEMSEM22_00001 [Comamonadaceae bacterium]
MLGIHESALAALLLHLSHHLQRQRGFAGRLRAIDFHHAATGQTAYTQRDVQTQRAGGHDLNIFNHLTLAQTHDGALAELLFDLGQSDLQGLGLLCVGCGVLDGCVHGNLLKNQLVG